MNVPVPENTPAIQKAERANSRLLKMLVTFAVLTFVASIGLVIFRFSDQAKQSTTRLAATRSLQIAERQDCRSEYSSIRNAVLDNANSVERNVLAATVGYLLSRGSTDDIAKAQQDLTAINTRVADLESLTNMVEHGWTGADGVKHPPCPVVK